MLPTLPHEYDLVRSTHPDAAQSDTPFRPLRVMIVDDNHINLSVLSTLLKRRFSALLDGLPVSVDSGLKAIQLLRTHVFDLILMDIQMPFLSGIDATVRIRRAEDGVLAANSSAHIVAVTTAVGDEPEAAYRRAGMDGMIGKPVRFQDMQQYLCPLSRQAHSAAMSIDPIAIDDGTDVLPPLPPMRPSIERIFYLPVNTTVQAPRPDICKDADFESTLRSQTKASLRAGGALAIAQSCTWSERSEARHTPSADRVVEVNSDRISEEEHLKLRLAPLQVDDSDTDASISSTETNPLGSPSSTRHSRFNSMTISKRTLSQQIERELLNMDRSDASDSESQARKHVKRPAVPNRVSSPAWLLKEPTSNGELTSPQALLPSDSQHAQSSKYVPSRPNWLLAWKNKVNNRSNFDSAAVSSQSSSLQSSTDDKDILSTADVTRRDSHLSNESILSDTSTEVITPAGELSKSPCEPSKLVLQTRHLRVARASNSSSTEAADPSSVQDRQMFTSPIDVSASVGYGATKRGIHNSDVADLAHTVREVRIID